MTDCIFCKIISKQIPADIVYEDEHTFAFLDINPITKGHTLVMPKKHFTNIFDMPEKEACEVMATIKKVAIALKKTIGMKGINVLQNNERAAGQLVMHSHTHLIPRRPEDGIQIEHGPRITLSKEEMQQTAADIKNAL